MLCDSYDVTVPVINRAGMVVTKAVDGGPANGKYYVPGETVHFKVTVHNNTGVTQKAIMVVDPLVGETKTCPDLNPGESVTLDFDYVVTEYDAIVGYVENYAYTMEIDGFSNTVWVDTGFDDPFGVITALEVIKEETSTPKDPRGYQLGETISYTITVKNIGETMIVEGTVHDSLASGSGEIGAFDNLYPDTSRTYKFSYKVTESDIVNHQVVNQAFAWLDGDVIPSEPVKSPTWSDEITEEEKKDTSGAFLPGDDFCKRELTGKGPATDAFSVHFCAEHLKVAEELEALKATASEEEYLKAARTAYLQAMDDMYEAAADKADSGALQGPQAGREGHLQRGRALHPHAGRGHGDVPGHERHPEGPGRIPHGQSRSQRELCGRLQERLRHLLPPPVRDLHAGLRPQQRGHEHPWL